MLITNPPLSSFVSSHSAITKNVRAGALFDRNGNAFDHNLIVKFDLCGLMLLKAVHVGFDYVDNVFRIVLIEHY